MLTNKYIKLRENLIRKYEKEGYIELGSIEGAGIEDVVDKMLDDGYLQQKLIICSTDLYNCDITKPGHDYLKSASYGTIFLRPDVADEWIKNFRFEMANKEQ